MIPRYLDSWAFSRLQTLRFVLKFECEFISAIKIWFSRLDIFCAQWCCIRAYVSDALDLFSCCFCFQTSTIQFKICFWAIFAAVCTSLRYYSLFNWLMRKHTRFSRDFIRIFPDFCVYNVFNKFFFHIHWILFHLHHSIATYCHLRFHGFIALLHKYTFCSFLGLIWMKTKALEESKTKKS